MLVVMILAALLLAWIAKISDSLLSYLIALGIMIPACIGIFGVPHIGF